MSSDMRWSQCRISKLCPMCADKYDCPDSCVKVDPGQLVLDFPADEMEVEPCTSPESTTEVDDGDC